jgi:hypothetical protein
MRADVSGGCCVFGTIFRSLIALAALTGFNGCSVPNLEAPDCTAARTHVREFYSFHFGNDMHPTLENVLKRERFLTRQYASSLRIDAGGLPPTQIDYFTLAEDLPKTFRIGECTVVEPGRTTQFEVLLFWKDDARSEQREITAIARKENDEWLIDAVGPKVR